VAVLVTPPPEAEIVTVVGMVTGDVDTWKPPAAAKAGTATLCGTRATAGLLLSSTNCTSVDPGEATDTRPEEPAVPVVVVGSRVSVSGGCPAVSVSCDRTLIPFQVAVTVAVVGAVTALVWTLNETDASPAAAVTVAGTFTAGESLDRLTTAPPAGATPLSMTTPPTVAPPVMLLGEIETSFTDGGWRV